MLQKRSAIAHEGGTWSCAGGALDLGEHPLAGALREASEEIGPIPDDIAVWGSVVFQPAEDWSYTTFVVHVPGEFGASVNFETDAVSWDSPDEVERRPRTPVSPPPGRHCADHRVGGTNGVRHPPGCLTPGSASSNASVRDRSVSDTTCSPTATGATAATRNTWYQTLGNPRSARLGVARDR